MQSSNEPSETARRFVLTGCVTAAVYCLLGVAYHFGAQPLTRFSRESIAWFVVLSLISLYAYGWELVRNSQTISARGVFAFGLLLGLICIAIAPFDSSDLFSYLNLGWEQSHYHLNPYVRPVVTIPGWQSDPMFVNQWVGNPCPYGFLFALIARGLTDAGGGNPLLTALVCKTFDLICLMSIAALLLAIARRLKLERPQVALYLFLWNPLVLLQEIANAHNDLLVAFFLILALYYVATERWLFVIPALVCGTLIKYPLAPTIPFALVLAAKSTSRRMVIASLALATLIAALSAAPYVTQIRQFPALAMEQNITLTTGSLKSLVDTLFAAPVLLFPQLKPVFSDLSSAFSIALWLSFAALLVLQLVRFSRADNALVERFIAAVVLTQFVLVAVVSSKSYPWYMNMFLPAAMLLPRPNWLSPLIIAVSCTELLGFTFVGRAHILDYLGTIALPTIYIAALNWPSVRAALAGEWRIEAHESLEQAPIAAAI